jgi:FMN phosphatase YigB (HAD superfamily)
MKTHEQPEMTAHPQYTWVVFDLDDTLISRAPNMVQQANLAALQLLSANAHDIRLLTAHLAHVYQQTTQGNGVLVSKRQQFRQLLHRLGRLDDVEPLFAAYLAAYISCVQVFPEVHVTLSALTAHGVHIGIATNGPPDVAEAVLQQCDMRQFVH